MSRTDKFLRIFFVTVLVSFSSCELLEPEPVDILTDDVVLNEPKDVPNVIIGLYSAFRVIPPAQVIAGDFTADMLIHNGTFSQFRELGTKQITAANGSVATLWAAIYNAVYHANFILERLPEVPSVPRITRDEALASAHFLRGYSYFAGLYSFGAMPRVLTTSIEDNRNIPRASREEILALILEDYQFALENLPEGSEVGYANKDAVKAALARYYLYLGDWANAETFANQLIVDSSYTLVPDFNDIVTKDFTSEAIFEVGYSGADDPGTNSNIGLNNLFVGRREIIPSNQVIISLASVESGDRFSSIDFETDDLQGADNGWSVAKYGTADEDNNNIVVFRLAEMYLIRAEARAHSGNLAGATEDINVLRARAHAPLVGSASQNELLRLIEEERKYELAFEGHRWYDLVRTGRVDEVMPAFNNNWKEAYTLWPIPQQEIQNNPALNGNQNPGY
jgi:starch-binding outer membrane protein, SusD/RagB family